MWVMIFLSYRLSEQTSEWRVLISLILYCVVAELNVKYATSVAVLIHTRKVLLSIRRKNIQGTLGRNFILAPNAIESTLGKWYFFTITLVLCKGDL